MKLPDMQMNWFDIVTVATLVIGVFRGRKRGMSEELLPVIEWLLIVFVGGLVYKPLGIQISKFTNFALFFGYVFAYLLVIVVLMLIFSAIKKMVGEKLVHADAFGGGEYYLGMLAGMVRFACMLLVLVNFVHAKLITAEEKAALAKMQRDNFGSISFPTLSSLQEDIFIKSTTGLYMQKYLAAQMIEPASSAGSGDTIARQRERMIDDVMTTPGKKR